MKTVKRGKAIVIALIAYYIAIQVISVPVVMFVISKLDIISISLFRMIIQAPVSIIIYGIALYGLYQGKSEAKRYIIFTYFIMGIINLILNIAEQDIIMSCIYVTSIFWGVIILTSESVEIYLRYQRGEYIPKELRQQAKKSEAE